MLNCGESSGGFIGHRNDQTHQYSLVGKTNLVFFWGVELNFQIGSKLALEMMYLARKF